MDKLSRCLAQNRRLSARSLRHKCCRPSRKQDGRTESKYLQRSGCNGANTKIESLQNKGSKKEGCQRESSQKEGSRIKSFPRDFCREWLLRKETLREKAEKALKEKAIKAKAVVYVELTTTLEDKRGGASRASK